MSRAPAPWCFRGPFAEAVLWVEGGDFIGPENGKVFSLKVSVGVLPPVALDREMWKNGNCICMAGDV